ncbi:MAG: CoA-binding protein [Gemmatimonadaceae bacterium]
MSTRRGHLLETDEEIAALLDRVATVAVLGIKPAETGAPAYYVPEYAQRAGLRIIPVPVYYPELRELLGEHVVRTVSEIGERVDLVNVFRRPQDIPAHVNDLLTARPRAIWFQSGIRHDAAAETLVAAGIDVVQDRCLLVELQQRGR